MTSDLDTSALARVLSQLGGDLVLVIDAQGLVLSVATGQETPAGAGTEGWEGRRPRALKVNVDRGPWLQVRAWRGRTREETDGDSASVLQEIGIP